MSADTPMSAELRNEPQWRTDTPDLVEESQADFRDHQRFYRSFVRGTMIFVAHVIVILVFMAIFLL